MIQLRSAGSIQPWKPTACGSSYRPTSMFCTRITSFRGSRRRESNPLRPAYQAGARPHAHRRRRRVCGHSARGPSAERSGGRRPGHEGPGCASSSLASADARLRRLLAIVDPAGIEPATLCVQGRRSPVRARDPEWTGRESHPDFRIANAASSCWTTSPRASRDYRRRERAEMVRPATSGVSKTDAASTPFRTSRKYSRRWRGTSGEGLLLPRCRFPSWTHADSNRDFELAMLASSRWTMSPNEAFAEPLSPTERLSDFLRSQIRRQAVGPSRIWYFRTRTLRCPRPESNRANRFRRPALGSTQTRASAVSSAGVEPAAYSIGASCAFHCASRTIRAIFTG